MPEYVYALNDYLENLDGEMSSHAEDQMEVVEKVDTAGNNAWWKGHAIEGRVDLVPQKIKSASGQHTPSTGGKKVSTFTMMDVQKAVEELRRLCAEDDNARCVSFASSDSTETDKPDFASDLNDVEDWYQATETTLAEYSDSGCMEKDNLEAQTATRASSFVLPRPMSNFSASEITRDTPGERIHSPARLSFPTSIYENIKSVPLSVSDQPTNGETRMSVLSLHTATDPAIASSSVADGVVCAPSDKTPSSLVSMHRPSLEDKNGKESGNERHPKDWTVAEVAEWLKSKGFDEAILDKFVEQEITGEVLLRLDTDMLKNEIGIRALGKRLRVASSITDLRQCPISSPSNSSITKTPLPPSSFRHASSSSLNLLSRKQHHSQSYHSLPEILDNYSSWKFPADLFDGPSAEIGSSSTHGSGIGLEIPFTINEDVPMSFETSSSLSHGHSSCNRAGGHHTASSRTKRHSRARYTLGGSKAGACERLVPGDSGKSQKPPAAIETHTKRPSTFSLPKGINMTSGTYLQRPSTSGGLPNEKEQASYVQRPSTSSGSQEKKTHVQLLRKEKDSKAIRTASATYFQRPSTSSGSPKKGSQTPIILEAPSDGEKSQGLPTASETRKKRSTFSLSNTYFQRPSTSSGPPKEPQSFFRESKKEKEAKTSEENLSTHRGTLRRRMSILAWRGGGPSVEGKGPIGAKGRSFYEQIGMPDHTGWMRKRADRYHIWNLRYFVLKGQRLYWLKTETDDRSEAGPTGFVDVVGYRVTVDETLDSGRYGFRIDHDGEKTHFFSSDERTVIREWMKAILKATISRDQTKPVTSSASNIQTIPLAIAQAMHPRPPSPTARDSTQKAHKRENPNRLSKRDARVLGFPSPMGKQGVLVPEPWVPQKRQPRKPFILNSADNSLVEWANSHLPARLQIHDATTFFGGLALLRLAESIKGEQASPPVPDRAFPSGPTDVKLDGLFHLLDFLLGSGVKMGSVSINDIRLGRRDKILELLKSLKAWEEKRGRAPLILRA